MKPIAVKLALAGGAAVVAGIVGAVLVLTSGGSESAGEHAGLLEPIGKAYAEDYGFEFTKVQTAVAATVSDANRAEWTQKVEKALAVGYDPIVKPYRVIPLEKMADGANIRMSRDRTPQQVVKDRVIAGNTIVEATWHFGKSEPVKSYAIVGPQGWLLFDTILSMPVISGPAFEGGHF